MKNIYLIQPCNSLSKSLYLPYSVGCLAAYAFQFEEIKENYNLEDFIFVKEDIYEVVEKMENPYLVGFSSYMWNIDYNLALAREIKKKWSDSIVVFGGPQIPDDITYLKEYDFIDVLIHNQGEVPFYSILSTLINSQNLSSVKNISFRENNKIIKTENNCFYEEVLDYPSPYTQGYFDKIINDDRYKDVQFDAVLETNRGCPYKCIYCVWGGSSDKIQKFKLDRVESDLIWMAENKIAYCMCADANFGILDRDEYIADFVVELKKKYGYPEKFETLAAKNKNELTFKISSKLNSVGLNKGVSVAVQSMTSKVLENIGRKNMPVENLSEQLKLYRDNNIFTYTDIILALPGETLESFCKSLFGVIEAGQHFSVNIYRFEFFPNTRIYSDEYVEKYKIKTIRSSLIQSHNEVSSDEYLGSRSDIVVETSTMTKDDWRKAFRISICTQSFHCMGLLRLFSIYLRKAKNISYYDFYVNLYEWIEKKSVVIKDILNKVCSTIDTFLEEKTGMYFYDEKFGNLYWYFDEGLFLECAYKIDDFYKEVKDYLNKYFDDDEIFEELLKYQKEIITVPNKEERFLEFSYNWYDYFENMFDETCTVPKSKKTLIRIKKSSVNSWQSYAKEIVWYGRRDNKTINTDVCVIGG